MAVPRLTLPLLVIQPKAEEARFWASQHAHLRHVDIAGAVLMTVGMPLVLWKHGELIHTGLHTLGPWITRSLLCFAVVAAVQLAAMMAAPRWWQHHRWHATVANRLLHGGLPLCALVQMRRGQLPYEVAVRLVAGMIRSACGTAASLTVPATFTLLWMVGWLSHMFVHPVFYVLAFRESAIMHTTVGVLYAWLASVRSHEALAVDPRLVDRARELCMALGSPAQLLGEVFWGLTPSLSSQCTYAGVSLPHRVIIIFCGAAAPLTLTWLAEYNLKTLYVTQRTVHLRGGQAGAEQGQATVGWVSVVARVMSVLALMYAVLWPLAALVPE